MIIKSKNPVLQQATLTLALLGAVSATAVAQVFTVQVVSPTPPTPLVTHGDTWHYRPGRTNAPQAGWTNASDAALDGTWATAPGGFGYGDPGIVGEATTLGSMVSNYSSLFMRRSFEITTPLDTNRHLRLVIDYDDAYVAYLDGVEVARSTNASNLGSPPPYDAVVTVNHEASCCDTPNSPTVLDLGPVDSRLPVGTHVLALQGINGDSNSSDFHLIADLSVTGGIGSVNGAFLSIVASNSVQLRGTNTIPGSAKVLVDGAEADFNAGTGAWSHEVALAPGFNRLLLQAVNSLGVPLFSTNQIVVSELASTSVGGAIAANTTWSPDMGIIRVTSNVTVGGNATLNIAPGTVVLVGAGFNIRAGANATIDINGAEGNIVALLPADGSSNWGDLAADGSGSALRLRHAETIATHVKFRNGATGLMEDSYIHHYKNGSTPIAGCTSAQSVTVRRCHFRTYHETLWQNTLMTIEDTLFEYADNASSDALDFDGAPPGSVIRRCTFRHGPQTNTDAIDIGPFVGGIGSTNTVIEDSLMFDFPNDKGISIGEGSYGITVRNCFIYGTESGIGVKDSPGTPANPPCTAIIYDCTIINCDFGFRCYNKSDPGSLTDGGQITNSWNNVLWNNVTNIGLYNGGTLTADHSDFGATTYPGEGNLDLDPLFLNLSQHDCRLQPNSPVIGSGRTGSTMGAKFPVGAPMALSHPRIDSIDQQDGSAVIRFWVDSEKTYSLDSSDVATGGLWTKVADLYPTPLPRKVALTNNIPEASNRFYRLVLSSSP